MNSSVGIPRRWSASDDGFPPSWDKVWRRLLLAVRLICWAVLIFAVMSRCSAVFVWDDSYMFYRYADNLIRYGDLTWNPAGQGTYGLTSPLFLILVLPIRVLFPGEPALTLYLSSMIAGFLFLALLLVLCDRFAGRSPLAGPLAKTIILFSVAVSVRPISAHFANGMDTTFAMAYLTAYLLLAKINEESRSIAGAVCMGLWGGLAFTARPDLMLYTVLVPVSIVLLSRNREAKRNAALALGVTLGMCAAWLIFASWYFGSPLPLSFYAKGLRLYDETIYRAYGSTPIHELGGFVFSYWFLVLIIVADVFVNRGSWWNQTSDVDKSLIIPTMLFILYYAFFVLQIMPYHARFYYPTFPVIAYLGGVGAARLVASIPESAKPRFIDAVWYHKRLLILAPVVAILLGCAGFAYGIWKKGPAFVSLVTESNLYFNVHEDYAKRWRHHWFELDKFSGLSDDLMIATTEVGLVAAMNPKKPIIDLAGLNETSIARHGFSGASFFKRYQPDLIYMPFPFYRGIISEIIGHPDFRTTYEHFPADELGTAMGVAIRRSSRYYTEMRDLVRSGMKRHPVDAPGGGGAATNSEG